MTRLDDLLAQHAAAHDDGAPESRAYRRELVVAIKREQFKQRLLGEFRRAHGRTAA